MALFLRAFALFQLAYPMYVIHIIQAASNTGDEEEGGHH